jgi:hypothetical protein
VPGTIVGRSPFSPLPARKAEWAHPEIEFVIADGPEPGSSVGPGEVSEILRGYLTALEDFRMLADEYRELGAEQVLVLFRRSGRGQHSGVEVWQFGTKGAWVFHIRCGRITKVVGYFDWERAFADLGLLPGERPDRSSLTGFSAVSAAAASSQQLVDTSRAGKRVESSR